MTKLTTASYVKITLIIALGLLILGSIGFGGCSAMRFGMRGGTEMGSANVDAASVKNLSVKWASGAVNIDVVDEGDAIELVETAPRGMTKAQQMRWSVNGDTLSIDYGTWFSCFALGRKDLQVRIPKSYAQNLGAVEIDGASGDYDVNGLGCETLKLKLASGDVDGQHLQADELRVDVASGQLDVEGRFADRVDVRTASGQTRIVCREACPKAIDADIASGRSREQRLHRSHRESVWSVQQLLLAFAERQRVHERRRKRQRQRAPGQRRVPHRRRRLGSSSLAILSERRPPGYHPERAKRVEGSRAAIAVRLPADAARDPSTPHFRRCAQDDDGMLRLGVSKHAKPSPLCRPFCASGAIIPMNCCIATMGSCGRGRGAGRRVFNVLTTSYLFLGGTGAGALAVLCVLE